MRMCSAVALLLTLPLAAQTSTPTLRASTRLVVLDVTVTDARGNPVHNLPKSAFRLTESKHPQTILTFEEHSAAGNASATSAPLPTLQPGIFTNVTSTASQTTPTILLLDYLNTPIWNQPRVRAQMIQYLRTAPPNTHIAIFGLNSKLVLLQKFTDDPAVLLAAIEKSHTESATFGNAGPTRGDVASQLCGAGPEVCAAVDLLDSVTEDTNENQRASLTLNAFHQLALYLAQIPGRKNLIWFSAAFPLNLMPRISGNSHNDALNTFNGPPSWKALYRETVDLLTRARVALFPIDARGLILGRTTSKVFETQEAMFEMADDTGGKAYINTNGFAQAIAEVVENGSSYYTFAYDPTDKETHGEFRSIHLALDDLKGYKLSYRRGYFADLPGKTAAPALATHLSPVQIAASYLSPTTAQIPFYARVLLVAASALTAASATTALSGTVVTDGNPVSDAQFVQARRALNTAHTPRFSVEYSAFPENLTTVTTPDGLRHAHLEFIALAYDIDGRVLGSEVKRVTIAWTPEQYTSAMQHGARYVQELSVGTAAATTIRLVIHDLSSDHLGSLDVNLTAIK